MTGQVIENVRGQKGRIGGRIITKSTEREGRRMMKKAKPMEMGVGLG